MALGWHPAVGGEPLIGLVSWLAQQSIWVLAAGLLAPALLWAALQWRRSRRRQPLGSLPIKADTLKEELRHRLAEPGGLFADAVSGAPTLGAAEAFDSDIAAAAKTVLREAGGHRTKAKALLRHRLNGHGPGAALNGSEAAYWRQLGVLSLLDGIGDSVSAYARAAELAPGDPEAQMLAGVLHLRAGNLEAAAAAFRRQIALGEGVDGSTAAYRGRTMLGDVHAAGDAHEEAIAAYRLAQKEVLALLDATPDQPALQRDLSVTCDRIGDAHLARGDFDAALSSYRRGLEVAQVLAGREPGNLAWRRDLSVSHDRVGDALDRKGDWTGALASYHSGLAIAEELARKKPGNLHWQWDLSVSHDRVGDMLLALGRIDEALASYRKGLAIAEALALRDPAHAGWQRDLAVSCHKLGLLEADRGNAVEAAELLQKGRAIIARLDRIAAHQAQWRADLSRFDAALKELGR
jgi:tetratricopeptide (TPR) repeat protein